MSTSSRKNVLALLFGLVVALGLFEGACQVYYYGWLKPSFDAIRAEPLHYYQPSDSPLAYELAAGAQLSHEGRRVHINRFGFRADSDTLTTHGPRIGFIGDSVTFGIGHTQEETIPHLFEALIDSADGTYGVLNVGTPGYAVAEIDYLFRRAHAQYDLDQVYFILNPNDFSWRNTVYEGGDNGLYRMYHPPTFKSLWFVRKLIYRSFKGDKAVAPPLYEWVFANTKERSFEVIRQMHTYAEDEGITFTVVVFPAGSAYTESGYVLEDMYAEIDAFLEASGIAYLDLVEVFGQQPERFFDETDHLTVAGNTLLAEAVFAHWQAR